MTHTAKWLAVFALVFMLLGVLYQPGYQVQANQPEFSVISGVLRAPEPVPVDGPPLEVIIHAELSGQHTEPPARSMVFAIEPGQSQVSFFLPVPPEQQYNIRYEIMNAVPGYVGNAWYKHGTSGDGESTTTVWSEIGAVEADASGLVLDILTGHVISGTYSLPVGYVLPGDSGVTYLSIRAERQGQRQQEMIVEINSEPYGDFLITVPPGYGYRVGYHVSLEGILSGGWYVGSGLVGPYEAAAIFDLSDAGQSGLNLVLGRSDGISGVFRLPDAIPEDGPPLDFAVYARRSQSEPGFGSFWGTVAPGNSSLPFFLEAPTGEQYFVEYRIYSTGFDYVRGGLYRYSATGGSIATTFFAEATLVSAGSGAIEIVPPIGNRISGSISLPAGYEPPHEGIALNVMAARDNETRQRHEIHLTPAESSATFSLVVPAGSGYRLGYSLYPPIEGIAQQAYYAGENQMGGPFAASLQDTSTGSIEGLHLTLAYARRITGTLSIPGDSGAPAGGLSVNISDGQGTGVTLQFAEGERERPYVLDVVPGEYRINYYIFNEQDQYVRQGYYADGSMVADYDQAILVDARETDVVADLSLISSGYISGTVFLPEGVQAPEEMLVEVLATLSGSGRPTHPPVTLTIPAGGSSAEYRLPVPGGSSVHVRFRLPEGDLYQDYLREGYYSANGLVASYGEAGLLTVEPGMETANINVTLVRGLAIEGTIRLPGTDVAPAGGLGIQISNNNNVYTLVTIPAGQGSIPYRLVVPNAGLHTIAFDVLTQGSAYVRSAFFGGAEVTNFHNQAVQVPAGSTGIDMTLVRGVPISGSISLPDGFQPSGTIHMNVSAARVNERSQWANIQLDSVNRTATFAMRVPEGDGYYVNYYSYQSVPGVVGQAYFSTTGTVSGMDEATPLMVGPDGISGIDLVMLTGVRLSGLVRLPNDEEAPAGGMRVNVWTDSGGVNVIIPAGQNSVPYSLTVPPGEHRLRYYLSQNQDGYVRQGYYHSDLESVDDWSSATLIQVGDAGGVADLVIIKAAIIRGTVSLPHGVAEVDIHLTLTNERSSPINAVIFAGSSSTSYSMAIAPGQAQRIRYTVVGDTGPHNFVRDGYYHPDGTTTSYSAAALVSNAQDGVDLTLMTGLAIEGVVSMPQGVVAPAGGLRVRVENGEGTGTDVVIAAGSAQAAYRLIVPGYGPYRVAYYINDQDSRNTGYLRSGYYSSSGTVPDYARATEVTLSGGDLSGVNLSILSGRAITGLVRLPADMVAPAGGLQVQVSNNQGSWTHLTIPAGQNSAPYRLTVFEGSHRLRYHLTSTSVPADLVNQGYYGASSSYQGATVVDVIGADVSGIDIDIRSGVSIEGMVSRPADMPLTAPLGVYVTADGGGGANVTIPAGAVSVSYRLSVEPGVATTVRYHIGTHNYPGNDLVREGFYSTGGTTSRYQDASLLSTSTPLTGINLTVIRPQIVGTVMRADGAPSRYGWVELRTTEGNYIGSSGCTQTGEFSFGGLTPGSYVLRAYPDPQTQAAPSADVMVTVGADLVQMNVTLAEVQFRVELSVASHGWVQIERIHAEQGIDWYGGVSLSQAGVGHVGGLSDGNYRLRAFPSSSGDLSASAYIAFQIIGGTAIFAGQTYSEGTLTVPLPAPQLYGVVIGSAGQPSMHSWVQLNDKQTGAYMFGVGTDVSGRFALSGLEDGKEYELRAHPNDRFSTDTPSLPVVLSTATVTSPQERLQVVLTASQITGRVHYPELYAGSMRGWVEVRDANGRWVTSVGIRMDGTYRIGGLVQGETYAIQAMAPAAVDFTNSVTVSVTVSSQVTEVDLYMRAVAISGVVTIPDGVDFTSVWVEVGDANAQWLFTVVVDAAGNFRLPALSFEREEAYVVQAFAPGFSSARITIHATTESPLDLELTPQE